MKVCELIKQLESFDPESEVVVVTDSSKRVHYEIYYTILGGKRTSNRCEIGISLEKDD